MNKNQYVSIKTTNLDLGYIMGFLNEEKQLIVRNDPDKQLAQFMPPQTDQFEILGSYLKSSKFLIINEPSEYAGRWKYIGRIHTDYRTYPPFIFEKITNDE